MDPRPSPRRRMLLGTGLAALLPATVRSQSAWPNRPIRLVVPFAPGGSNDILARVVAARLGPRLGQPIVVENRGGAGGTLGTELVAKSAPDGYTLMVASTSIATNAASGKKLPYDPVRDLEPIGLIGAGPFAVVAAEQMKVNTLAEFVQAARARPGAINYGSAGIGGLNHLGTELFAAATGIQLTHVPYKGIGPAFVDLMAGNLQMLLPSVASVLPHIRSGKVRGLAVTSLQRSPLAPELPTVAESGWPGFEIEVWWGVLGPAGLPPEVATRLNTELNAVLATPEVRDSLANEGASPRPGTAAAFGTLIRAELVRWTQLVRDAKIQVE